MESRESTADKESAERNGYITMSVLQATGVLVGKRWDKRNYTTADGKPETMDLIRINLADPAGAGPPVELEVTKEQYQQLALWKTYALPVEARSYLSKAGGANLAYRVSQDFDVTKGLQVNASNPVQPLPGPAK